MLRIILSRLLQTLVVVFLLVTFTFFAIRMMPGNPFADVKALTEENKAAMERLYGLDKPLHIQYANYWKNVLLEGDFGDSFSMKGRKVSTLISESFPISLKLGLLSLFLAMSLGIPLGIIAALFHNKWQDYTAMIIAMAGICIVTFVLGPIFQLSFAKPLSWLNVAGWSRPSDVILPAITLCFGVAAYLARLTRGGMLDILSQDYIRSAKAKGVSQLNIITKHALRPPSSPQSPSLDQHSPRSSPAPLLSKASSSFPAWVSTSFWEFKTKTTPWFSGLFFSTAFSWASPT